LFYSHRKEKNVLLFTRYLRHKIEIKSTETEIHAFIKKDLDCGLLSNESVNVLLKNVAMQYHEEKSARLVRMQQLPHLTLVSLSVSLYQSIINTTPVFCTKGSTNETSILQVKQEECPVLHITNVLRDRISPTCLGNSLSCNCHLFSYCREPSVE